MGIPTLISTSTASDAANVDITSGIDSTYDEYMFVCTDIHPRTDGMTFQFQFNASGGSGFNETITSTFFRAYHNENDSETAFAYNVHADQAQGTAYQTFGYTVDGDADACLAGILHLFSPSNTTYVTHFYGRSSYLGDGARNYDNYVAGYVNSTAAMDEISFKFSSGNIDGVIQMYGIS